ncbi:MAG: hypothetical protein K2N96_04985, partial [Muribaculaceae bacterium]|nr:hypothetical protein [Muribaculaceae bacterium]
VYEVYKKGGAGKNRQKQKLYQKQKPETSDEIKNCLRTIKSSTARLKVDASVRISPHSGPI